MLGCFIYSEYLIFLDGSLVFLGENLIGMVQHGWPVVSVYHFCHDSPSSSCNLLMLLIFIMVEVISVRVM